MPPRSSSRKKSNRQTKKPKLPATPSALPNHHSSPAVQSQGDVDDLRILRDQNGRNGNYTLRPNSEKCQFVVVEEKKKGFSVTVGHNEMEGSVDETQKVESLSLGEDKQVVDVDEEKAKSIAESSGEVAARTQQGEQDSNVVIQKEESSSLFDSEKIEERKEAVEAIIEEIKELAGAESKPKEIQEKETQETEPSAGQTNEVSSALETETSRETEAVEAATEAEEDKLASSEEKKEDSSIEANEALKISESSVPETEVLSRAIEETTILKPEETEESKLVAEEGKVEESTLAKESSKEEDQEAKESLPPSTYVAAAETTSSKVQVKTEIPRDTESQENNVPSASPPREYTSWRSCCGILDFLFR